MEPLSAAASMMGVVSLAVQVCNDINQVHNFWLSVKDAPADVQQILDELDLFMQWISIIAEEYRRSPVSGPTEKAAMDTLMLCWKAAGEMNAMVKDLESGLAKSGKARHWNAMKAVLRKEKIEKTQWQIERMKSVLNTAQIFTIWTTLASCVNGKSLLDHTAGPDGKATASVTLQNGSPIGDIQRRQGYPKHTKVINQRQENYAFWLASLTWTSLDMELITVDENTGKEYKTNQQRISYNIRMSQWLWRRAFSWYSNGMFNTWTRELRTFRYIPEDSRIVEYCKTGDIDNVQKMFDWGLASPFDRVHRKLWGYDSNPDDDYTLLHYATEGRHVQLCKLLIRLGLGNGVASGVSYFPILTMVFDARSDELPLVPPDNMVETLRVLVEDGQYDPAAREGNQTALDTYKGPAEGLKYLLNQNEFVLDFEDESYLFHYLLQNPNTTRSRYLPELVATVLEHQKRHPETLQFEVLPRIVYNAPLQFEFLEFPKQIALLVSAGADVHLIGRSSSKTLLDKLLEASALELRDRFSTVPRYMEKNRGDPLSLESDSSTPFRKVPRRELRSWYPADIPYLPGMELIQRLLDAWVEIIHEAGIDMEAYGRREESLHPDHIFSASLEDTDSRMPKTRRLFQARFVFDYGEKVDGLRIRVVELLGNEWKTLRNLQGRPVQSMPGGWIIEE
ncbi:MAG: hypothetical protein M1819_002407 [Sarea resinae]|nr:MAG: hypothetical protein M1819_002407 [Sarea resinae]